MAKLCHALEYSVNLGHDVLAVDDDGCALRRPQSDMQNCPLLRDVDFVATEHRIDLILKTAFLGQLNQELYRLVGYAILGVVKVKANGIQRQTLPALWIIGKELTEVSVLDLSEMSIEFCPSVFSVGGRKVGD